MASMCKDQNVPKDQIPYAPVNVKINLDLPSFQALNIPGGFVYIDGQGVKGLVVVNSFSGEYFAFERDCPWNPNDACAKVTVEKNGISMKCGDFDANNIWQDCCGSVYDFSGLVKSGPSIYPLKRYNLIQDGSFLYISN